MKNVLIVIAVLVVAFLVWFFFFKEEAPATPQRSLADQLRDTLANQTYLQTNAQNSGNVNFYTAWKRSMTKGGATASNIQAMQGYNGESGWDYLNAPGNTYTGAQAINVKNNAIAAGRILVTFDDCFIPWDTKLTDTHVYVNLCERSANLNLNNNYTN